MNRSATELAQSLKPQEAIGVVSVAESAGEAARAMFQHFEPGKSNEYYNSIKKTIAEYTADLQSENALKKRISDLTDEAAKLRQEVEQLRALQGATAQHILGPSFVQAARQATAEAMQPHAAKIERDLQSIQADVSMLRSGISIQQDSRSGDKRRKPQGSKEKGRKKRSTGRTRKSGTEEDNGIEEDSGSDGDGNDYSNSNSPHGLKQDDQRAVVRERDQQYQQEIAMLKSQLNTQATSAKGIEQQEEQALGLFRGILDSLGFAPRPLRPGGSAPTINTINIAFNFGGSTTTNSYYHR